MSAVQDQVLKTLRTLDEEGISVRRDGETLKVSPPEAATPELWAELKKFKPSFFDMLAQWPTKCLRSELEMGQASGRLYLLLGHRVRSPRGIGTLLLVGERVAVVHVDSAPRPCMFRIFEIWPAEEVH